MNKHYGKVWKRRIWSQSVAVSLVFFLLLGLFPAAQANAAADPTVEVGNASGKPGDTVTVSVQLDPGGLNVKYYQIKVTYDPDVLELTETNDVIDETTVSDSDIVNIDRDAGSVEVVYTGDTGIVSRQNVFSIRFVVKAGAAPGVSAIEVETAKVGDLLDVPTDAATMDGSVTVKGEATVKIGTVPGYPGQNVTVPVTLTATTHEVGSYGIQIQFDASALEVLEITSGNGDLFGSRYDNTLGELKAAWADATGGDSGLTAGDELFNVTFKIKQNAALGDKALTVDTGSLLTFSVTDTTAMELEKTPISGAVTVRQYQFNGGTIIVSSGGGNAPMPNGIPLIVNGKEYDAIAAGELTRDEDKTKLTATIDKDKLEAQLEAEGDNAVIIVPVSSIDADQVVTRLTADTVKMMEDKDAVLEIQTGNGNYKLPAKLVDVERISSAFGGNADLLEIVINVEVSRSDDAKVQLAEDAAQSGNFAVVVPPVDFTITATYNGRTIEIDRFEAYIQREIPLPSGVNANRVTTAIVVEDDGTVHHVPTYVTVRDGVYYAVVNSLTNSTYTLVWNQKTFADTANHWAKNVVNDMASRMVVSGVSDTRFNPDNSITRAEFAAIMVRALGLSDHGTTSPFTDVKAKDWYVGAVAKAYEYGLIAGYADGTFRPNDTITRQEAIVILQRAMKWTGLNGNAADVDKTLSRFADAPEVAAWAKASVAGAVDAGLVQGSNGALHPTDKLTRAEATALVQRLLQKSGLID